MPKQRIPLSQPVIARQDRDAAKKVLSSGILSQGQNVESFENEFAKTCGSKHAVATSSGTTALHIALLAHSIGKGDEVITTPFTFIATIHAIIYVGATPVFVDIEEDTFNLNPQQIASVLSRRTKAILPVHLFGHPCQMEEITKIADAHKLIVIEDAAQALGASYNNTKVGSTNTACFSFYATKNITTGEGGMITTNDNHIARQCRLLRNHGMKKKYDYQLVGYNYRLTEIAAAIGLQQLKRLHQFNNQRKKNAAYYDSHIRSAQIPSTRPGCVHAWHQYTIRFSSKKKRTAAARTLDRHGIGTGIFYDPPLHRYSHLQEYSTRSPDLSIATQLAKQVLSLPIHPSLRMQDLQRIMKVINGLEP